ncbi:hypothetical protein FD754_004360 [Muntiacus muntjak]|uniref:G-protein coupled receptors family 1 profile domain-containing protein n=1 Tax=Muntiacus muntjak TaxID=9888 RepID=A0A5N3WFH3_MUNMU|nr:hypothetical protein FD754_004360 [Muntiacus muntjak]
MPMTTCSMSGLGKHSEDLSYNLLEDLPSFSVCQKLQKIENQEPKLTFPGVIGLLTLLLVCLLHDNHLQRRFHIYICLFESYFGFDQNNIHHLSFPGRLQSMGDLRHNEIYEIQADTFQQLFSLRSLAALNMPANLENSSVAPGLKKVCFHSNPKERQCQRMHEIKRCLLLGRKAMTNLDSILTSRDITLPTKNLYSLHQRSMDLLSWVTVFTLLTIHYSPPSTCPCLPKEQDLLPPDLPPEKSVCRSRSNRGFKKKGTYAYLWLIHVDVWQKLTQYCKPIILQLKKKKNLAWNKIAIIHPNAFSTLPSLRKLDLSSNRLSSIPVTGLHGLTHLKLTGNHALQSLISSENFPELKVIEMPYAYQCCAFGVCENVYKISNQWNKGDNSSAEDLHKKDAGIFQVQDDRDLEDFLLDFEEDLKALHPVQCSPSPGPFKLCEYLFGSWLIRIGVWTIAVLALTCNALVTSTVFRAAVYISSIKLLIGLIAAVNMLMGVSSAVLAGVDAFTFGSFAQHGAWWEQAVGCQVVGFLFIFASESSVFLLTLAALERGWSVKCSAKFETQTPFPSLRATLALCALLAGTVAAVPLLGGSEYSASPLCLPLPFGEPRATCYMVALVLLNSLCFLVMTVAYTRLYCHLEKGDLEGMWDCSMVKHVALLLFTNCILHCPVAFLSFSSLLNLTFISPEVIKFILLVIVPLPACLNPLLYILFNPHFKEDLGSLGKQTHFWTRSKHTSLMSINSDDVEKQSCDSTQALVTFTSASIAYDLPSASESPPAYPMTESCHLSSVAFVPCL